jgi:hypothetical protein
MTPRTWTLIFMALMLLIIATVDAHWALDKYIGNTISEMALGWSRKHPIGAVCFGLALGILLGHLFAPQYVREGP